MVEGFDTTSQFGDEMRDLGVMPQQDLTGFVQIFLGMGVVCDGEVLSSQETLLFGSAGGSPLGISPLRGGILFGDDNFKTLWKYKGFLRQVFTIQTVTKSNAPVETGAKTEMDPVLPLPFHPNKQGVREGSMCPIIWNQMTIL